MIKKLFMSAFVILFFLFSLVSISAITASIGNSRMVLYLEPGEEIDKYILVRNVNDFPADITFTVVGDLKDYTKLREDSFTLEAGEEKKAYFTIEPQEVGKTETTINVLFSQTGEGAAGLSSKIIIITREKIENETNEISDDNIEELSDQVDVDKNSLPWIPKENSDNSGVFKFSSEKIIYILTPILVVILLLLVFYYSRNGRKERSGESSE